MKPDTESNPSKKRKLKNKKAFWGDDAHRRRPRPDKYKSKKKSGRN